MDTLYTFWDNITHSKNKGVHFLGLMNSATKEGNAVFFKRTSKNPDIVHQTGNGFQSRGYMLYDVLTRTGLLSASSLYPMHSKVPEAEPRIQLPRPPGGSRKVDPLIWFPNYRTSFGSA